MHSEAAAKRLEYYKTQWVPPDFSYQLNDPGSFEFVRNLFEDKKTDWASLAVFDGKPVLRGNASKAEILSENAAENYLAFRDACHLEKADAEPEWTLGARMIQDGPKVSAAVTVTGEGKTTDKLRLHAILCERSVMAIERSGVFFHHFVAREALTPPEGLDLKIALERPVEFTVDAEKMREGLTRMLAKGNRRGLRSKPTYVDANKLMVVVFVQHQENRRVLAAKSFSLPQQDEAL